MDANWRQSLAEGFLAISVEPTQDQLERQLEAVYQARIDRGQTLLAGWNLVEMLQLLRQRRELRQMLSTGQGLTDIHSARDNTSSLSEPEHLEAPAGQCP